MRQYWDLATDWQALPIISFDGSVTGHDFSDVLLGRPASFWQGGGQYQRITAIQQGYYVQDRIKGLGGEIKVMGIGSFADMNRSEFERYGKLVRDTGMRAE